MDKKVLFVANVLKKHINVFHLPFLEWFKVNGYQTYVAAKNDYEIKQQMKVPYCDHYYDIPFSRSPLKIDNLKSLFTLRKLIKQEKFDIIHCHTPVASVVTRLAILGIKRNTKIVYTAHGFHFYKGAVFKKWLIFYPIEKILSKLTDILITINEEDYSISSRKFYNKKTVKINGVGINTSKFSPVSEEKKQDLKCKLGFSNNDFLLIYVGELTHRKRQELIINTMKLFNSNYKNIKLLLVGDGERNSEYKKLIESLDLHDNVQLLGFRNDIDTLMKISDVAISTSRQEGLPVNILEAMASGLPVVVTNCRGNRDLIEHNNNGYIVEPNENDFFEAISKLYNSKRLRLKFGQSSRNLIAKYDIKKIKLEMGNVYKDLM